MILAACCTSGERIRLNEHQWAPDEAMRRSKQEHADLVDRPLHHLPSSSTTGHHTGGGVRPMAGGG
jgi:hypothetical protein